eukprot:CAMPEP_0176085894 /NCGR_PEP_ID=MMETSP0120_2-20121206/42994_1 /TAXON_ID=160619 /ORGANISM="Kryptoperidinium foliaceum, Strain CCMP 1326" /LENGTH=203 /DNA_ID=CAMNT_0017419721 /DNA_START=9 /DNA_END=616 /DNA_ORIENTATION=+
MHREAAVPLDASPIKVIADVQDILRPVHYGVPLQLVRNQELGLGVHLVHVTAAIDARGLALGLETFNELVMAADALRVRRVPPRAGEDGGPRHRSPTVGDQPRPAVGSNLVRPERAVQAAPVPDRDYMHGLRAADGHGGERDAVVVHRSPRRSIQEGSGGLGLARIARRLSLAAEEQVLGDCPRHRKPRQHADEYLRGRHSPT